VNINITFVADFNLASTLNKILGALEKMSDNFTSLNADVAALNQVLPAVVTAFQNLSAQIAAIPPSVDNQPAIDALDAQVKADTAALQALITPAAPVAPVVPPAS
jgi:hypothetical protein